jgi:NAD(P)-dependent dehydrogenase (short-subunit alcohol dehydrogenase family)
MTKMIEEDETMLKQTLMVIPAGRMGDPIDIATAALYLASNESDYVTGTSIVVDGVCVKKVSLSVCHFNPSTPCNHRYY